MSVLRAPSVSHPLLSYTRTGSSPRPYSREIKSPPLDPNSIVGGRYRIGIPIGRGGMSWVFRAEDIMDSGKQVALKIAFDKQVKYLEAEARVLAKAVHQNIVTYFGDGAENGMHYLAMEYVPGKTVEALLKEKRQFSVPEVLDIITQVCYGLGHLQQREEIHGDIKPANMLVTESGQVKIIDFGLGSALRKGAAEEGSPMGTIFYMSPEQSMGAPLDHRSDIYSLGIVFYCMLTGKRPFDSDKADSAEANWEIALQHEEDPLPEISGLDKRTEDVLIKMTAKRKEDRYPHYSVLITDLGSARRRLLKGMQGRRDALAPPRHF